MMNLFRCAGMATLLMVSTNLVAANCDLTEFSWDCEIPVGLKEQPGKSSIFFCGNSYGYLTHHQMDVLSRYRRASVNMVMKINGQYVDSQCVPAKL